MGRMATLKLPPTPPDPNEPRAPQKAVGRRLAASLGMGRTYDRVRRRLGRSRSAEAAATPDRPRTEAAVDVWRLAFPIVSFCVGATVLLIVGFAGGSPAAIGAGIVLAGMGPIGLGAYIQAMPPETHDGSMDDLLRQGGLPPSALPEPGGLPAPEPLPGSTWRGGAWVPPVTANDVRRHGYPAIGQGRVGPFDSFPLGRPDPPGVVHDRGLHDADTGEGTLADRLEAMGEPELARMVRDRDKRKRRGA